MKVEGTTEKPKRGRPKASTPWLTVPRQTSQKLERSVLHEQVYKAIRNAIMSGHVVPGVPLTVRALAAELGTSMMPVREAVRRLVTENVLEMQPNRTVVLPIMTPARFREIRAIRMQLEGLAVREATPNIDAKMLKQLSEILERYSAAAVRSKYGDALELNFEFHSQLYALSRMPLLISTIESLWLQTGPFVRASIDATGFKTAERNHGAVMRALRKGDAEAACQAVQRDILEGGDGILKRIGSEVRSNGVLANK